MKKVILLSFASLIFLSAESFAMETDGLDQKAPIKRKAEEKEGPNEDDAISHPQNKKKLKREGTTILEKLVSSVTPEQVQEVKKEEIKMKDGFKIPLGPSPRKLSDIKSQTQVSQKMHVQPSTHNNNKKKRAALKDNTSIAPKKGTFLKYSSKNLQPKNQSEKEVKVLDHVTDGETQEDLLVPKTSQKTLEIPKEKSPTKTKGTSTDNLFKKEQPFTLIGINVFRGPSESSNWENFLNF